MDGYKYNDGVKEKGDNRNGEGYDGVSEWIGEELSQVRARRVGKMPDQKLVPVAHQVLPRSIPRPVLPHQAPPYPVAPHFRQPDNTQQKVAHPQQHDHSSLVLQFHKTSAGGDLLPNKHNIRGWIVLLCGGWSRWLESCAVSSRWSGAGRKVGWTGGKQAGGRSEKGEVEWASTIVHARSSDKAYHPGRTGNPRSHSRPAARE